MRTPQAVGGEHSKSLFPKDKGPALQPESVLGVNAATVAVLS
jgi:hypothetical protein